MKFENYDCWKHKNCLDVFIYVSTVIQDDNNKAIIHANWMTQGVENHWFASERQRLFIKEDQYDNWEPYDPIGKLKLFNG